MYFPPDTVRQKQTDPNLFCGCFSLMQAQAERNPETRRNSTWTENPSTALELTRSPWYSFDGKIISGLLGWVVSFYIDIHIYIYILHTWFLLSSRCCSPQVTVNTATVTYVTLFMRGSHRNLHEPLFLGCVWHPNKTCSPYHTIHVWYIYLQWMVDFYGR